MYIRKKTKKRNVSQNIRMDVVQLNTSNSEARRPVQIPPSSTSPIHSGGSNSSNRKSVGHQSFAGLSRACLNPGRGWPVWAAWLLRCIEPCLFSYLIWIQPVNCGVCLLFFLGTVVFVYLTINGPGSNCLRVKEKNGPGERSASQAQEKLNSFGAGRTVL